MAVSVLSVDLRAEEDVVQARQRARQIGAQLGMTGQEQTKLATAVSEIARNAVTYGKGGRVEFSLDGDPPRALLVKVEDRGPGIRDLDAILRGKYVSTTGMGIGLLGSKRLVDRLDVATAPGGTTVTMTLHLEQPVTATATRAAADVAKALASVRPQSAYEELQAQNRELLMALDAAERRGTELTRLSRELEETNKGVLALYAELDEKRASLERASDLKSRFLSNMTHEFRTPLNSIVSLSRLLLDRVDGPLAPEQEKQVSFILKSAEVLSGLVNDLLDLARIEAGRVKVKPDAFELADLLTGLRGVMRPLLANEAVQLVIDPPTGLPTLHTDEGKLAQILRNLLSNALKFTERGEVRVWAEVVEEGVVAIRVKDTGIGIAPEHREIVFEEFEQVETAQGRTQKGTGLGLPLSRRLARLLGGELTVESALGQGSTFSVTLPMRYEGPAEVADVPLLSRQPDPARLPVLFVDRDRENLFLYDKFLKGSGVQVLPAESLDEARKLLRQVSPAAVVLSAAGPQGPELAFLAELRAAPATRALPVFVVGPPEVEADARSEGATDFGRKPADRRWLLGRLKSLPREQRALALVIDDDEVARYLMKSLLAESNLSVIEASDGERGLVRAREDRPAVVFLDLKMPGLSGWEVLERLKADEATRDIPVIIRTSLGLSEVERQRLLEQAVAVLSKEAPSRQAAQQAVNEALVKAGLG